MHSEIILSVLIHDENKTIRNMNALSNMEEHIKNFTVPRPEIDWQNILRYDILVAMPTD